MDPATDDPQRLDTTPPGRATRRPEGVPLGSRYYLEYPIGRGACGRVWHGRRREDDTPVAIKVLREEYAADAEVVARFLRERTTLQGLSHENLVPIYDLVIEGDTLAVVMELVNGMDLRQLEQRTGLSTAEKFSVLAQIARALDYIHAAGIVHRDVKPENILVTRRDDRPWARLSDFGLAWAADGLQLTDSTSVVGTPAYLAPELLASRPYGTPVDIYALGVTAHELLCGRRPFAGDHPLAIMRAHLDDQPRRPPGMAKQHWRIVRACLAKRPDVRPSAGQLAAQFERLANGMRGGAALARSGVSRPAPRLAGGDNGLHLAVDFGAAFTTAMVRWPNGQLEPLLFDDSPLLPSAVHLDEGNVVICGREALAAGRRQPARCDPYPKLRVDETTVTLGGRDVDVVDLVAALLARVVKQVRWMTGTDPTRVSMTHPPSWREPQLAVLRQAAHAAGLPAPAFLTEPAAVAAYFTTGSGTQLVDGGVAVIYDLGASSFSATVVRRGSGHRLEVIANEWRSDVGGIDVDDALLAHVRQVVSTVAPDAWQRLSQPANPDERRTAWYLWENVRQAKELLEHAQSVVVEVPLSGHTVDLSADDLDRLARPVVAETVAAVQAALASAGVAITAVAGVYLVGGGSRVPIVQALLRRMFGRITIATEPRELAVVAGALTAAEPPAVRSRSLVAAPTAELAQRPAGAVVPHRSAGERRAGSALVRRSPQRTRRRLRPASAVLLAVVVVLSISVAVADRVLPGLHRGSPTATDVPQLIAPGLAGPPDPAGSASPSRAAACGFKIAVLGKLTATDVLGIRDSAKLAVDQYNGAHPDCTVALAEYDTFDPATNADDLAAARAQQIAADPQILGVVGPMNDVEVASALPVLNQAGVATISPAAPGTDESQRGWTVFHRTCGSDRDDADAAVREMTEVLHAKNVFVIDDDTPVGAAVAAQATTGLGKAVVGKESIDSATAKLAPLVAKIHSSGADTVYYTGYLAAGVPLLLQLHAAAPNLTVIAADRMFVQALVTMAGSAANGVYLTSDITPPPRAGQHFADQFQARFNAQAPFFGPEAFDAATALLSGIDAGNATRTGMLTWVDAYDRDGISRHIKFTVGGDLTAPQEWAIRVVNGYFVPDSVIPDT